MEETLTDDRRAGRGRRTDEARWPLAPATPQPRGCPPPRSRAEHTPVPNTGEHYRCRRRERRALHCHHSLLSDRPSGSGADAPLAARWWHGQRALELCLVKHSLREERSRLAGHGVHLHLQPSHPGACLAAGPGLRPGGPPPRPLKLRGPGCVCLAVKLLSD